MNSPCPDFDIGSSWSKLPPDLLHSVFERLGFADFQRAQYVCSSWYSGSRKSQPHNQIPWLILFPKDNTNNSCTLFNPEEKDKLYKTQDLGAEFAESVCMATYGSWFLMRDSRYNLYFMNLFTRERIDLPPVESQLGIVSIERTIDDMFLVKLIEGDDGIYKKHIDISLPLFWIDEKTKDYVVFWLIEGRNMVYSRKRDKFWKQTDYNISDMVYNDHKLYMYSQSYDIVVLDFSEDIPQQIFETQVNDDLFKGIPSCIYPELGDSWHIKNTHFVVTVNGEILRVKSKIWSNSDVWSFRIHKMNSSHSEWEKVTSLGDEAILLDLGITVLANALEGINRNSIYFSGIHFRIIDRVWSEKDIFIFNLNTHKVERPHQTMCSSIQSSNARWFVPNFNIND